MRSYFEDDFEEESLEIYHYGNYKADANITIINSKIIDCSFS